MGWCYISSRGADVPCTTLSERVGPSFALFGHVCTTSFFLVLYLLLLFRIRPSGPIYLRVGRGRGFARYGYLLAHQYEQIKRGVILPLQAMYADIVRWHPGPPDAMVCGLHQSDGNPTLDVNANPGLGLPPLFWEVAGYPFKCSHHLYTQYPINEGDEQRKMPLLLEGCHQVHFLFQMLCLLKTLFRRLHWMGLNVIVHHTHIMNTLCTILTEVTDQEVALLFKGL